MSGGNDTVGEPALALIFSFFAVVVGCFFTFVLSRVDGFQLPYTVWVFLFGIMISRIAIAQIENGSNDALMKSTEQWMNIDPDLLLYALLPPLLFDEAMKLDIHQVRLALPPSMLLAMPGAAFGAYMQGIVCYYMLGYDWVWLFCFMVGSVLSATDPVSVVSMLKSVSGGSTSTVKLTYLITGESLLNDGTALVIFEAIVSKHYSTQFSVVTFFIKVIFISPAIGVLFGLMTVFALRKAKHRLSPEDNTIQIAITIACAYISFFVSQWVLKVSGIISCCTAGVIIAWLAPALIIRPDNMEVIWHTLEWIGNTMIFAVAGLIVGKYAGDIDGSLLGSVVLIYITMMLIRLSMLAICYFPIKKIWISEYSWKDVLFSTFGGLRGAISLALVLIIEKHLNDPDSDAEDGDTSRYFDAEHGRKAMVIICCCVFMTIVINGSLAGLFFQKLYGSRLSSDVDEIIFHYVEKRIRRKARDFISHTDVLPPFDAEEVKKLCHCFDYHFSTVERTAAEDAMLRSEKAGVGHVEFEESGSGKHKVAHLVAGPDLERQSAKKETIFGLSDSPARTAGASNKGKGSTDTKESGDGDVQAKRNNSSSSIASLAFAIVTGRNNSSASLTGSSTNIKLDSREGSTSNIKANRMLSQSVYRSKQTIGEEYILNNDLIVKFRQVFHGITKHCYMRQVQNGRITRGSSVALCLLHASRHGMEKCDVPGLHDFESIQTSLEVFEREASYLRSILAYFPNKASVIGKMLNALLETYVRDRVYILTSFIEAHNYAQRITVKYLGEKGIVDTEEEALIIAESNQLMKEARKMLAEIDIAVISFHATEMVTRMVLHMANDTVMQFQEEGILSEKDTEVFLEKSYEDLAHLHSDHHRHEFMKAKITEAQSLRDQQLHVDVEPDPGSTSPPPSPWGDPNSPHHRNLLWFLSASSKIPQSPTERSIKSATSSKSPFDLMDDSRRESLHNDPNSAKLRGYVHHEDIADSDAEECGGTGDGDIIIHTDSRDLHDGGRMSLTEHLDQGDIDLNNPRDVPLNVTEMMETDFDLGDEDDKFNRKEGSPIGRRSSLAGRKYDDDIDVSGSASGPEPERAPSGGVRSLSQSRNSVSRVASKSGVISTGKKQGEKEEEEALLVHQGDEEGM